MPGLLTALAVSLLQTSSGCLLLCLWVLCSSVPSSRSPDRKQVADISRTAPDPFLERRGWSFSAPANGHSPGRFHRGSPLLCEIFLTRGKMQGEGGRWVEHNLLSHFALDAITRVCSLKKLTAATSSKNQGKTQKQYKGIWTFSAQLRLQSRGVSLSDQRTETSAQVIVFPLCLPHMIHMETVGRN